MNPKSSNKSRRGFTALVTGLLLVGAHGASATDCGDLSDLQFEFKGTSTPEYVHPGDEFTVDFRITANREIEGFSFFLDYNEEEADLLGVEQIYHRPDNAPFEIQTLEINTDNNVPNGEMHSGQETLEEGFFRGEILFSSTDPSFNIQADQETAVFELRFRVRPDMQHGQVDMAFRDLYTPEGVTYYNTVTVCGVGRHEGFDANGSSAIGPSVVDCLPEGAIDVSFTLKDAISTAGSSVTVPFLIQATELLAGYAFSMDFDEEVLQATEIELVYRRPDGQDWGFQRLGFNNANNSPGNAGTDEGYLGGGVIFSLVSTAYLLPANQEHGIADLHFTVRPGAQADSTAIRFLDGARIPGMTQPIGNNAVFCGETALPATVNSFVFVNGVIGIIDEIVIFRRADSNGDERVDVSDAVHTLGYLFQGGDRPSCYDAADANDDGEIDISDPVTTLEVLFLGSGSIPAPSAAPGEDPTPDSLRCIGAND